MELLYIINIMLFLRLEKPGVQSITERILIYSNFFSNKPGYLIMHDRTENLCTVSTSRSPIQSLRKLF